MSLAALALAAALGFSIPNTPQTEYLAQLAKCESGIRSDIKVWDVGSYSYSMFQFKMGTFIQYGKKYNLIPYDISDKELELLIMRPSLQLELAKKMLTDGGEHHWKTCTTRIGEFPSS